LSILLFTIIVVIILFLSRKIYKKIKVKILKIKETDKELKIKSKTIGKIILILSGIKLAIYLFILIFLDYDTYLKNCFNGILLHIIDIIFYIVFAILRYLEVKKDTTYKTKYIYSVPIVLLTIPILEILLVTYYDKFSTGFEGLALGLIFLLSIIVIWIYFLLFNLLEHIITKYMINKNNQNKKLKNKLVILKILLIVLISIAIWFFNYY